jgi:hypothetical protein
MLVRSPSCHVDAQATGATRVFIHADPSILDECGELIAARQVQAPQQLLHVGGNGRG